MAGERILILGGTGEARGLAGALIDEGFHAVTSLAGVTLSPRLPAGEVRRGGFGGEGGLADYVKREDIRAILDATHPYAAQMSRHAHWAAQAMGVPYLRLERAPWQPAISDCWIHVASIADAVAALPGGARAFVTIGRKEIAAFFARPDLEGVARMIEPPVEIIPPRWTLLLERPPFSLDHELGLIDRYRITHLVSKNAGGEDTRAKLLAARERKIPVIMVARPVKPEAPPFSSVEALIPALRRMLSS
ncbi:MAG: cobalt-precorrin-6A reductase [Aestuariivirga sp.]